MNNIEALENGYFVRVEQKGNYEPAVFWLEDNQTLWTANKQLGRFERPYKRDEIKEHFENLEKMGFEFTVFDIFKVH